MLEEKDKCGYNVIWIDRPESELQDLLCPICGEVYREPVQTNNAQPFANSDDEKEPCGHHFCEKCILRWLEEQETCPTCRRSLTSDQLAADMTLRRKIRNLPCKCRNDSEKCSSKGTIGRDGQWWLVHEQECLFTQIECPLCHLYVGTRQNMNEHLLLTCQNAFIGCRYQCGGILPRKLTEEHEMECVYRPLECKDCKMKIPFVLYKIHLATCKMLALPCDFSSFGCKVTFLRKDLQTKEKHTQEQMGFHLSLVMKEMRILKERINKLEGKLEEEENVEGNEEIEKINSLDQKYQQQEFAFAWSLSWCDPKMKTYSGILIEAFGGKWGFAYGSKRASPDDIPIFIKCHDLNDKILLIDYGIAVVDPRTGEEMKQYKKLAREFQKNDEYGYTSLIKLSDLEKAGAFDRMKGLSTLLFRARLRLASR